MNQLRTIPRQEVALPNTFGAMSMSPEMLIQRMKDIDTVRDRVMQENVHYYTLDGDSVDKAKKKWSLGKAGAEVLCLAFQLTSSIESTIKADDPNASYTFSWKHKEWFDKPNGGRGFEWKEDEVTIKGYYEVQSTCAIFDAATGICLASASGNANSREAAFRNTPTADARNPVLKRAEKRALVAAALIATASSALFTQDVEDMVGDGLGTVPPKDTKPSTNPSSAQGAQGGAQPTGWMSEAQKKLVWAKAKKAGIPEEVTKHVIDGLNAMDKKQAKPYLDAIADEKPEAAKVWEAATKTVEAEKAKASAEPPQTPTPSDDIPL
jgi:hypothetical protein